MDNLDLGVLRTAAGWRAEQRSVVLGTITRTWGSAPRPVGSLVAVRDDGLIAGSVSGGCIEDDLVAQLRAGSLTLTHPAPLRYGVGAEEARRFGLPCGGTLRLVQEPLLDGAWIDQILDRTAKHGLVARTLDVDSGRWTIEPATRDDVFTFDGHVMRSVFGPRWRMLIIGAGQLSRVLAQMSQALDFEVTCCDPREEYYLTWDIPGTHFTKEMPDDVALGMQLDPHSAVVAVTHDPKLDDLALLEALKSPAFYVGALGSRANTAARKERLAMFELTEQEIGRLHGPIGLDIGSKTPAEIAISILAEIIAVRNDVKLLQKKPAKEATSVCAT